MQMRFDKIWVRLLVALSMALPMPASLLRCATTAPTIPAAQFPAIQATNLNNKRLHFPEDFSGQLNLVVISFAREQQHDVDTWIPMAREIQSKHSKFNYYELPTMSRENLLYRWWFDAALRNNTNDRDLHNQILTAYVNKRKFLTALHIADEKQAVAVLVDRAGKIYWRADGAFTEQDKLSLLSVLTENKI